jgi:hypothetical protein
MLRKLTIVFFCLALSVPAFAHGNLKFVNGLWFDGSAFVKRTVYSVDNVFRDTWDGEARTIDLAGRFVIPPLADAHNHAFGDSQRLEEQLARYLRAGVFYVQNPNNLARLAAPVRERLGKPETIDVTYANGGLTSTGGHPAQIYARYGEEMEGQAYFVIDRLEDLERKWDAILAGKPDLIKVYLDHSEEHAKRRSDPAFYGRRGLDPALLPAIVERAHRSGLRVAAHVTTASDFRTAVTSGVDEIAHLPLERLTTDDAELTARRKTSVVTTLLSHRSLEGVPDPMALHRANLLLLSAAGVTIAFGVDNDQTVVDEIDAVARLGVFSNAAILRTAVTTTALEIFPRRKIGSLTDGSEASFLALDANPLEDLAALRRIGLRVKQGHVIEVAPLKPSIAEALMPIVMTGGAEKAIAEYRRLEREAPASWDFSEARINQLGYALLQHARIADAVAFFELNVEKFPRSSNAWDSLGEGQLKAGWRDLAIASYRRALELDPKNQNAAKVLDGLLAK